MTQKEQKNEEISLSVKKIKPHRKRHAKQERKCVKLSKMDAIVVGIGRDRGKPNQPLKIGQRRCLAETVLRSNSCALRVCRAKKREGGCCYRLVVTTPWAVLRETVALDSPAEKKKSAFRTPFQIA